MDKKVKLLPIVCCGECKHSAYGNDIEDWRCWYDPTPIRIVNIKSISDFCKLENEVNKNK